MNYIEDIFTKEVPVESVDKIYNEITEEVITANVKEAVRHFMGTRGREKSEDARYLYKEEELDMFYREFKGDPDSLVCNPVYDEHDEFLCWEIVRKEYFEEAKRTGKSWFCGREGLN